MKAVLQRILFSTATLGWATVLLAFYANGRLLKYLAPDFRPICLVGGLGLAVLGFFVLLTARHSASCGHDHGAGDSHDHETPDVNPIASFLILLVPLALAVAWTKDSYSEAALSRKGLYDTPKSSQFLAASLPPLTREEIEKNRRKTPEGALEFSLMELFFASGDSEMTAVMDGLKVETEGRIMEDKKGPGPQRKRLYRLFMTCCVADSRAIPIVVEWKDAPPPVTENAWMKVRGIMRYPNENGQVQPVLEVEQAIEVEAPPEEAFQRKNHMGP